MSHGFVCVGTLVQEYTSSFIRSKSRSQRSHVAAVFFEFSRHRGEFKMAAWCVGQLHFFQQALQLNKI